MKILLLSILILLVTSGSSQAQNSELYNINVMSFNVRIAVNEDDTLDNWEYRKTILYNTINKNDPDILCTQEPYLKVINGILDSCPGYETYGRSRNVVGSQNSESCHIFYKNEKYLIDKQNSGTFWFSPTPESPGSMDPDAKYIRICTYARFVDKITGKGFYVYNNHWDNESASARLRSAVLLEKVIEERQFKSEPYILTGDLNATETQNSIKYLYSTSDTNLLEMEDTYRLIYPDISTHPGYTKHEFDGNANEKIDYIIIDKNSELKTLEAKVEDYSENNHYPSDHFPVLALMQFDTSSVSIAMQSTNDIYANLEDGQTIEVTLWNDTFINTLNIANWSIDGLQEGVSIGNIERLDSTNAIITLSGNSTTALHISIRLNLTIQADELTNSANPITQNVGISIYPQAISIPGTIQAEHYNSLSGYDVVQCSDLDGGFNIISNETNSAASYKLNVDSEDYYTITYRVSSGHPIGMIELNTESEIIDTIGIHAIGGTQEWSNIYSYSKLPAGEQLLNLTLLNGNSSQIGFNWIQIESGYNIPSPSIDSAFTKDEKKISLYFDRLILEPIDEHTNFKVYVDNEEQEIDKVSRDFTVKHAYIIALKNPLSGNKNISISYNNGNVTAFDGSKLENFSKLEVYNNLEATNILHANHNVILFPNPAQQYLNIAGIESSTTLEITIFSILGEKIRNLEFSNSKHISIDVSDLKNGMYFLHLNMSGIKASTHKIYIQQ